MYFMTSADVNAIYSKVFLKIFFLVLTIGCPGLPSKHKNISVYSVPVCITCVVGHNSGCSVLVLITCQVCVIMIFNEALCSKHNLNFILQS